MESDQLEIFQLDAFAEKLFQGNPAAVVSLKQWLPDDTMAKIAIENNLAETAFYIPSSSPNEYDFHIRWFTQGGAEVKLCGHATLATGYVIFNIKKYQKSEIKFLCKYGVLSVSQQQDIISMIFSMSDLVDATKYKQQIIEGLKINENDIVEIVKDTGTMDYIVVQVQSEEIVKNLSPNLNKILEIQETAVCVTSQASENNQNKYQAVSRLFAPRVGINEDPVTGSAHVLLTKFWSEKLQKQKFTCIQLSPRQGIVYVENLDTKAKISGKVALYLKGNIFIK